MSADYETLLRTLLIRLSSQRPVTESGVQAALALALWDGVDVPQDVRDVIGSMGGQVEHQDAEGRNE